MQKLPHERSPGLKDRILLQKLNLIKEGANSSDPSNDSDAFRFLDSLRKLGAAKQRRLAAKDGSVVSKDEVAAYRAINSMLSAFRLTPVIVGGPSIQNECGWELTWYQDKPTQTRGIPEYALIAEIAELAQEGRLDSLKQCEQCKEWLLARFSHQRFCSSECKEEFHRSNPQDKARRREWARNNYWLHKTKNLK